VTDELLFERRGDVGVMTLNRPDRLNALTTGMMARAAEVLADLAAEGSVRCLVLTGAGRGFCSGADLGGESRLEDSAGRLSGQMKSGLNKVIAGVRGAAFPVVTAVNGPAAGAGVGLALAGDFLVAAESMSLFLSFARIGMGLDGGVSYFLPRLVGPQRAMASAMLMQPIGAAEAQAMGLAWNVVPDDRLQDEALALAGRLAAGPPLAFRQIKRQLLQSWSLSLDEALDLEANVQGELVGTEDMREGVAAYRQKRPARFTGR
jgi:2-(1,2-epoxy-1,2-dihydrophenyl)acetyl-CoA isomerase